MKKIRDVLTRSRAARYALLDMLTVSSRVWSTDATTHDDGTDADIGILVIDQDDAIHYVASDDVDGLLDALTTVLLVNAEIDAEEV